MFVIYYCINLYNFNRCWCLMSMHQELPVPSFLMLCVERLVTALHHIHFREVESRVRISVSLAVQGAKVAVHLWASLRWELTVEDEHVLPAWWRHRLLEESLDLRLGVHVDGTIYVSALVLIRVPAVDHGHVIYGAGINSRHDITDLRRDRHTIKNGFRFQVFLINYVTLFVCQSSLLH